MTAERDKIVGFPVAITEEEKARRVMVEATRLANLAPGEWRLWIDSSAERLGIARGKLEAAVLDIIKAKEKKARTDAAEKRRLEQRVEKQKLSAQRAHERQQRQIEKDAERKSKEKQKAFAAIIKLPSGQQDGKLVELAKRIGEDIAVLRDEFSDFVSAESSVTPSAEWHVEPWPQPVGTAALLQELIHKIDKHVVAREHEVLAIALWVLMSWVHEIATHSAYLVATSAEPDSGKSTLLGVLGQLVPKPFTAVESTGPSIFRFVDREKPTLLVDEADDLFQRKVDVKHVFNAAWTRGTKIARQVSMQGVSVTVWFDPFCPKAVGLLGMNLPRTLVGRSIIIKLWPKKADEKVESFSHTDDDEFFILRRKLARWAADKTVAIKDAKPLLPANFNNRAADNWKLLLVIAELAGGGWPKRARDAAERLSRTTRKPSWRVRLLAALQTIFATGRKEILSKDIVAALTADADSVWNEYSRGGQITTRQVADLLSDFEIYSGNLGPKRIKGYRSSDFEDAFARYLPPTSAHPLIKRFKPKTKG